MIPEFLYFKSLKKVGHNKYSEIKTLGKDNKFVKLNL